MNKRQRKKHKKKVELYNRVMAQRMEEFSNMIHYWAQVDHEMSHARYLRGLDNVEDMVVMYAEL